MKYIVIKIKKQELCNVAYLTWRKRMTAMEYGPETVRPGEQRETEMDYESSWQ